MDVVLTPLGPAALRIEVPQSSDAAALAAALREARIDGISDVSGGESVVVVYLNSSMVQSESVQHSVTALLESTDRFECSPAGEQVVEIPVVYDGADLDAVAKHCALSVSDVIARHHAAQYRVAFCGFAPGFGYLTGGDQALAVPRRSRPRTSVPAGSVGLAGVYSGVYPSEGPGGWQIIGTTNSVLFDASLPEPSLLRPGTVVRFVS